MSGPYGRPNTAAIVKDIANALENEDKWANAIDGFRTVSERTSTTLERVLNNYKLLTEFAAQHVGIDFFRSELVERDTYHVYPENCRRLEPWQWGKIFELWSRSIVVPELVAELENTRNQNRALQEDIDLKNLRITQLEDQAARRPMFESGPAVGESDAEKRFSMIEID